ncbi:tetratricopeptide repeat protein [Chitinivibrio alkaliphilus]|uniref:tetratricopeptide repeat protein n=1 Tax=Chitinivibrio alkaliphilus TaxID=1505232 RepID=UPI00138AC1A8|nr:tetratricopeptide repeat protein [Chitinivibrio alkaliphilus]
MIKVFAAVVLGSAVVAFLLFVFQYGDGIGFFARGGKDLESLLERGRPKHVISRLETLPSQERGSAENLLLFGKAAYLATWQAYEEDSWRTYAEDLDDWFSSPLLLEGIQALQRAAEVDETAESALLYLGVIFMERGMFDSSRVYYERLLRRNTSHYQGLVNYGVLLSRMGKNERARAVLQEAEQRYPDDPAVIKNLFWLYLYTLHEYETAVEYGDRYVRIAREQRGVHDLPKVIQEMRHILERFPEYDSDTLYLRQSEPPRFQPRESMQRWRERMERTP